MTTPAQTPADFIPEEADIPKVSTLPRTLDPKAPKVDELNHPGENRTPTDHEESIGRFEVIRPKSQEYMRLEMEYLKLEVNFSHLRQKFNLVAEKIENFDTDLEGVKGDIREVCSDHKYEMDKLKDKFRELKASLAVAPPQAATTVPVQVHVPASVQPAPPAQSSSTPWGDICAAVEALHPGDMVRLEGVTVEMLPNVRSNISRKLKAFGTAKQVKLTEDSQGVWASLRD